MKIIYRARQAGKTTEAVKLAVENQYEILVMNHREAERLLATYPDLKKDQVFTWEDLAKRREIKHYYGTVIDNVDWVLDRFMPSRLRAITITDFEADAKGSDLADERLADSQGGHKSATGD